MYANSQKMVQEDTEQQASVVISGEERRPGFEGEEDDEGVSVVLEFQHLTGRIYARIPGVKLKFNLKVLLYKSKSHI